MRSVLSGVTHAAVQSPVYYKAVNQYIIYKFLENEQVISHYCVRTRSTLQPMPVPEQQPSAQRQNKMSGQTF